MKGNQYINYQKNKLKKLKLPQSDTIQKPSLQ